MRQETEIKFELDKFEIIEENLDEDFALCKIYVCSDGKNLHNINIALEAIIKAQETLKNKYLVTEINKEGNDFMGHESSERIIGHFPESSKMEIVQYKNRNFLTAQALISKVYASQDYFILAKGNHKGVSMEIKNIKWNKDGETVDEFEFHGVTVLGDSRTPAISDANIEIMVFESNQHYDDYLSGKPVNNKNSNKKEDEEMTTQNFEDNKNKVPEEPDDKTTMGADGKVNTEPEKNTGNPEAKTNEVGTAANKETEPKVAEQGNKMSYEALEESCKTLKDENASLKKEIASFKNKEFESTVNSVLFEITHENPKIPKTEIEKLRKEKDKYSLESVNGFCNFCKAAVYDLSKLYGGPVSDKTGVVRIARPDNVDFATNINKEENYL